VGFVERVPSPPGQRHVRRFLRGGLVQRGRDVVSVHGSAVVMANIDTSQFPPEVRRAEG
jgi:hypothetical protein